MLKEFDIEISRLKNGVHEYEMDLSKGFEHFALEDVDQGQGTLLVHMEKTDASITVNLTIKALLNLTCDRSLEPFEEPLQLEEQLIFKYGDHEEELDDRLFLISTSTPSINLTQHLKDFIGLAIPFRKIHPKLREEVEAEPEDSLIYEDPDGQITEIQDEEEPADPRFAALKALKQDPE